MHCPYCSHDDSRVIDSREAEAGIRRRRECFMCGRRFTTYERVQVSPLLVVKKDGRREEFDRHKVLSGVRRACEKRPLPAGALEALVDGLEANLQALNVTEVPSARIGEMVMERLRALDHIAYIRFASVYRQFADLDELRREVEALRLTRREKQQPPDQLVLLSDEDMPPARAKHGRTRSNA